MIYATEANFTFTTVDPCQNVDPFQSLECLVDTIRGLEARVAQWIEVRLVI